MLTEKELKGCKIKYEVIKEALEQSKERLGSALQIMRDINQKTLTFFNAYLTILIGLISAGFIVKNSYPHLFNFLLTLSPFLFCSLIFFLFSLRNMNYGTLGSEPEDWLEKDLIEGDKDKLSTKLGEITLEYQEAINTSFENNDKKFTLQEAGVSVGVVGIVASTLIFFLSHPFSLSYVYLSFVVLEGAVIAYFLVRKS
jgi:hypothetical protein